MRLSAPYLIGALTLFSFSIPGRAAEADLVGQWQGTFKDIREIWTIGHDSDKWSATVVYTKAGKQVGASHGEEVEGTGHELNFTRIVDIKVDDASIDRQLCKVLLMADGKARLEIQNGKGFYFKNLSRIDGADAAPAKPTGSTPPNIAGGSGDAAKPVVGHEAAFPGVWLFHGEKWDEVWTVTRTQDTWSVNTIFTQGGQQIGAAHAEHVEYSASSKSLVFTRVFDKAPGGTAGQTSGCELVVREDKLELHIKLNNAPVKLLVRQTPAIAVVPPVTQPKVTPPAVTPPAKPTVATSPPPATPAAPTPPPAVPPTPVAAPSTPPAAPGGPGAPLVGRWALKNGKMLHDVWIIEGIGNEYKVSFSHYAGGKVTGAGHGDKVELIGTSLHFTFVWDQKSIGPEDHSKTSLSLNHEIMTVTNTSLKGKPKTEKLLPVTSDEIAALTAPKPAVADTGKGPADNGNKPTTKSLRTETNKTFVYEQGNLPKDVQAVAPIATVQVQDHLETILLSGDGKRILARGLNGIGCYDIATRKQLWWNDWDQELKSIATLNESFSSDGAMFVMSDLREKLHFWECATGKPIARLDALKIKASRVVFHPARPQSLLVRTTAPPADGGSILHMLDLSTGRELWKSPVGMQTTDVVFSSKGDRIAYMNVENNIGVLRVLDSSTGKLLFDFPPEDKKNSYCNALAWSPDGKRLGAIVNNEHLQIFDVDTHKMVGELTDVKKPSPRFGFLPDGQTLIVGGFDTHVRICDVTAAGKTTSVLAKATDNGMTGYGSPSAIYLLPDGQTILLSVANGKEIRYFKLADALSYPPPGKAGPATAPFTPGMLPKP